ncbi:MULTISPECIES: class I SAM-dependent methyltransferase [Methylomonas]|uniref:Methyltransferase domain-containing protein n=1 Tax=Methylomonas koyamae TaxID=702114 RepID=A0A177NB73_9GAMM|nr:class I SAM-dependent methyltransferase [Methylomonas koyamae]OAI15298.1 hypothetical protein A1355_10710 [Methylomonas koyamae]
MNHVLSNAEQYSKLWESESDFLEAHGIYEQLSKITPDGNAIEFGCGIGNSTRHLSTGRNVLSLDNNPHLIKMATKHINEAGNNAKIHKCDFFDLKASDKRAIKDFNPAVIVGWFIGSHGIDIFKHTDEEPDELTKSKLYREKIEDIIVSSDVCLASVDYIHLVNRGALVVGFSDTEYFKHTKDDYDTYVFGKIGFEVVDVKNFHWPREGSEFQYGAAFNPNLAQGETIPAITSIVARRVK